MELPIVAILLVSSFTISASYPKDFDILPKDYYKRQVLQPIPGYIPVYIKADPEPQVRLEKVNENSNTNSQGVEEKNQFRNHDKEIFSKENEKKFEQTKSESLAKETSKTLSEKFENDKKKEKLEKGKNLQLRDFNQKRLV